MSSDFQVDPMLAADTVPVGETDLCSVLLNKDSRFPWAILVPKRAGTRELHDLGPVEQIQLMGEITHIAQEMQAMFGAEKTNVAALGNQVAQLHVHIVMRFSDDAAWPNPIWGRGTAEPYPPEELDGTVEMLKACLP